MKNDNKLQMSYHRYFDEWLELCPFPIKYSKNIVVEEATRYTIKIDIPNTNEEEVDYYDEDDYYDEQPSDV
jgi:lipocalin|tara:strand:- start:33 stop:245 length:213 start_codon:yes stop_codon:yes gene_type:complete